MNMSYTCYDIDKTYDELKKSGVEFEGRHKSSPGAPTRYSRTTKETGSSLRLTENTRGVWLSHADATGQTARPAVAPYHLRISTRYFLPARV